MNSSFINIRDFKFPGQAGIISLKRSLKSMARGLGFDIFDFEMLFRDEGVKRLLRDGDTIGCFYIESPGMRSLLRKLSCDTFEMLTAASSIIRPGVAESGMMQEFIERHRTPAKRKYLVPEMEQYLGETYGVMIYQEDVIKVAHHIAGLTLEEADLLRRAMSGKLRSHSAMEGLSKKFFTSCAENGLSSAEAHELWRQIESFAGYAFCKAHSASFALLSFQVAYLKVHFPAQFMASVLSNMGGFYFPGVYIQEAKRMGLKVLLPCINESLGNYTGRDDQLRIGLMAIGGLPAKTISRIVEVRKKGGPYDNLNTFLSRTGIGREDAFLLIKCGAADCLKKTRPTLMRLLDLYFCSPGLLYPESGYLFEAEESRLEKEIQTDAEYTIEQKCAAEYEAFGYMVSRHPLEFYPVLQRRKDIIPSSEIHKYEGKMIKMAGWYMTAKRIRTKKGSIMKFLSLEDLSGTFEAILFPEKYTEYAEQTLGMGPYLIEGKIDTQGGNNIIVNRLAVLSSVTALSSTQKDSVENEYFGDREKVSESEFSIVEALGKEELRRAYTARIV